MGLSFMLRAVARSREPTTEQAIARIAGVDPAHRNAIAKRRATLEAIDRAEDAVGSPLLSAVVVTRAPDMPGAAFFAYARERGVHAGNGSGAAVHGSWYHN